jgi:hypothetical protein
MLRQGSFRHLKIPTKMVPPIFFYVWMLMPWSRCFTQITGTTKAHIAGLRPFRFRILLFYRGNGSFHGPV